MFIISTASTTTSAGTTATGIRASTNLTTSGHVSATSSTTKSQLPDVSSSPAVSYPNLSKMVSDFESKPPAPVSITPVHNTSFFLCLILIRFLQIQCL